MKKNEKWKKIGQILKSKKGNLYIKFEDVSTLNDGDTIMIEKPEVEINRLHELGYIKDEELEGRLENIPDFVKYNLNQGPHSQND